MKKIDNNENFTENFFDFDAAKKDQNCNDFLKELFLKAKQITVLFIFLLFGRISISISPNSTSIPFRAIDDEGFQLEEERRRAAAICRQIQKENRQFENSVQIRQFRDFDCQNCA